MNYEQDMKIDDSALDYECLEQAELMRVYTRHQAELQRDEDVAREELDYIKAELDKKIRMNPDKYGLDKVTEGAINNTIITTDEYQAASKSYINAKFENNSGKGAVRSCDQRKSMIETLTKLHGQAYFAGPKVPRDLHREVLKKQEEKRVDAGVARTLRRTKQ